MKGFRISGLEDGIVFLLFLAAVRWCHWQDPLSKTIQYIFLSLGTLYYVIVYIIEVRKVRR